MKAYILMSNKTIEPFGEHPRDCLIVNRKLMSLQKEALYGAGHKIEPVSNITEIKDSEEHIIFVDSLYFTRELLVEFITRSRKLNQYTVCAAVPGITTLRTVTNTQDVVHYPDRIEYGLY